MINEPELRKLLNDIDDATENSESANNLGDILEKAASRFSEHDLEVLIQPFEKRYWYPAALLLKFLGYPAIIPVFDKLFEWLKDLNWPGADTLLELLIEIDPIEILPRVEGAILRADSESDGNWLAYLKSFVQRANLVDKLQERVQNCLKNADW